MAPVRHLRTTRLIDWRSTGCNDEATAEEVKVHGPAEKRTGGDRSKSKSLAAQRALSHKQDGERERKRVMEERMM